MIEPPRHSRRCGVLEVDDCILVTRELTFVKQTTGAMHQATIAILCGRADALTVEARKHRRRTRAIETVVMKQNAQIQTKRPHLTDLTAQRVIDRTTQHGISKNIDLRSPVKLHAVISPET